MANALTFGLEWGANFNFRNKYSVSTSNSIPSSSTFTAPSTFDRNLFNLAPPATPTPQLIGAPSGNFDLGVIGEVIKHNGETYLTLGSLLNALQNDSETTIVMTPKILAQDGRTSTLFQGFNVPFAGSFVSNTGQNSTLSTTNIEYRNIGMNLTVTPVLGNSDIVTLDISFEQSQQTGSNAGTINIAGTNVSTGLTTSQTTMQTTVHVPDKHFLILSGNVNNSVNKTKSGIPCLGGLPLIGAAFSSSTDTFSNQNIVVFLRPHILTSMDDMKQVSINQEEFFRDQAGTPFLQHNFDEAMDYVKSVEDE
jgi:type III secretion protein C